MYSVKELLLLLLYAVYNKLYFSEDTYFFQMTDFIFIFFLFLL